jgi:hypothetical protein
LTVLDKTIINADFAFIMFSKMKSNKLLVCESQS